MTTKPRRNSPSLRVATSPRVEQTLENQLKEPPANPQEALLLIQAIQSMRQAPLITFVTAPDVTLRRDVIEQVYEQMRHIGHVPQLDIFLHSRGGQTEVPWRLITLFRDFADRFTVLIPGIAHSAATHLAMGANEIIMGPFSELSPVDPARAHPLLPGKAEGEEPLTVSVQDLQRCIAFVKEEIGPSSPEALAQVISVLFDKVHPLAIGAIQQSNDLARLISRKALSTHMDPNQDEDRIARIVAAFSDEFFSHGYPIGWKEAQAVGLKVVLAPEELWEAMWQLYKHYKGYFSLARVLEPGRLAARPIAWIDSTYQRRILEEVRPIQDDSRPERISPPMARWIETQWESNEPETGEHL